MAEPFQQLVLKEQPFAVLRARVDHFFQCEHPVLVASLAHQVDCAGFAPTEQLLHTIVATVIVLQRSS